MPTGVQRDLIYDLGLHKGYDSEFYLNKGFRVVALEAVPELAEMATIRLKGFEDRISIINKALFDREDETVSFYTVPTKDDWGSLFKGTAEKGVEESVEIQVPTIILASILDKFGTPYYIKCDMEGGDLIFIKQLLSEDRRPTFVSVEVNSGAELEILKQCGYEFAQIVNQSFNWAQKPPHPPREGEFSEVAFSAEHSGLFGRELPPEKWVPIEQAEEAIALWKQLQVKCPELVPGWADVHVCRAEAIGRASL